MVHFDFLHSEFFYVYPGYMNCILALERRFVACELNADYKKYCLFYHWNMIIIKMFDSYKLSLPKPNNTIE